MFCYAAVKLIKGFISKVSERECGRLEYPLNGQVNVDTYGVGGVARYSCNKGYRLHGHSAALCLSNGEFDPSHTPICRRKSNLYQMSRVMRKPVFLHAPKQMCQSAVNTS